MQFTIPGVRVAQAQTDQSVTEETHAEVEHVTGQEDGFPPFDPSNFASQIFWLAITFAVLYLLMARSIIPRIGGIIEARRNRISHDLDQAAAYKEESDAALAAYEHELAEARRRAHELAQKAQEAAKAEADEKRRRVEAELNEKLAAAETRITAIKEAALAEVDDIAVSTAGEIVRQLLDGHAVIDEAEVTRAVEEAAQGGGHGV